MAGHSPVDPPKPRLRGVFHQWAFFAALAAGVLLVLAVPPGLAMMATVIYVASLVTLYGVSALYHRIDWPPDRRLLMRRLDHSAIYVVIAGTYTPFCMLAMPGSIGWAVLAAVWAGALLGVVKSVLWPYAPKAISALIYVLFGCMIIPFAGTLVAAVGAPVFGLVALGGVLYGIGALVYAIQRPNPVPHVFGYHEIFHVLVVAASVLHFTAVSMVAL